MQHIRRWRMAVCWCPGHFCQGKEWVQWWKVRSWQTRSPCSWAQTRPCALQACHWCMLHILCPLETTPQWARNPCPSPICNAHMSLTVISISCMVLCIALQCRSWKFSAQYTVAQRYISGIAHSQLVNNTGTCKGKYIVRLCCFRDAICNYCAETTGTP